MAIIDHHIIDCSEAQLISVSGFSSLLVNEMHCEYEG